MRTRTPAILRGDGLPGRVVVLLVFLSCFSPTGFAADNANPRSSASVPTIHPETLQQVRDIESQVRRTIRKVLPCVVGVERSSGTIVSAEGHVLCAAHTVKAPGREVEITLADGKKLKGKVLGVNVELDGAMVKIEAEGPFPFVELGQSGDLRPGQWCLDAGHPGGFRKDRPAVFRLGRVCEVTHGSLRTDNYTTGGDSGGPVFDLAGRLIGTHSRGGPISINAPIDPYRQSWERFLAGEEWGQRQRPQALQMLTQMPRYVRPDRAQQALAELVVEPSRSVVRVFCDGQEKCLGTVVEKEFVVTKASELAGKITCRDRDGQQWPARVIGADARHDLALLKLPSAPLVPITWADAGAPALGRWVAAPSADGKVLGAGIVSVPEKAVARSPGTVGAHFAPAETPVTVQKVLAGTGAEEAGLQVGDVITAVNGKPVATVTDLLAALCKHQPGEAVTLSVKRGELAREVRTTLDEFRTVPKRFVSRGRMIRAGITTVHGLALPVISTRRHGFPAVIQHDSVLSAPECGGPLIDLSGKAVGVNIARVGGFRTYALPAHLVIAVVKQLKLAQKPEAKATAFLHNQTGEETIWR